MAATPATYRPAQVWPHWIVVIGVILQIGFIILLAVIARLALRFRHGVPGHAPGTSAAQAKIATLMQNALYGLLIAMALTGMLTWNGIAPLGGLHFALSTALFFAAIAHGLAALFNQVVRKDGTLARMVPALRKG